MLNLPHFRIHRFTLTKIGLNLTIEILSEDLPRSTRDTLETLWKDGNSCAGAIQEIDNELKEISKEFLTSKLHNLMRAYCEKNSMSFEEYNQKFKTDYGIKHKNEMSLDDLKNEIERHKVGLQSEL